MRRVRRFKRFTLVELMTVLAIVMILASMMFPSLAAALRKARAIRCIGYLTPWYTAQMMYSSDFDSWFGGVYVWGLAEQVHVKTGWKYNNVAAFARYLDKEYMECPARTDSHPNDLTWPPPNVNKNMHFDYWVFMGSTSRCLDSSPDTPAATYWAPGGWTDVYWDGVRDLGFGAATRATELIRPSSVMAMDRLWTQETANLNVPGCTMSGPPVSLGSNHCGIYWKAGYQYSNHRASNGQMGEGANFLCFDGSAIWVSYDAGDDWQYYTQDYYRIMMAPTDEIFNR